MSPNSANQIGNRILHKMRALRQAAINAHNIDTQIHQLRDLINSGSNTVLADLDKLKDLHKQTTARHAELLDSTRLLNASERIRLFHDLDASIKYQLSKLEQSLIIKLEDLERLLVQDGPQARTRQAAQQPLSVNNNKFLLFNNEDSDFVIPSEDVGLISYLKRHGTDYIEPGTRRIIRDILTTAGIAVDIGANFGLHALAMCHCVGPDGKVYAFEPTPSMAEALRQTAICSRLRNLQIIEMAVTDKEQTTQMYSYGHSPENSLFTYADLNQQAIHSFAVQTCSLDSFFSPGSRIDLVKIDAEGAEPLIFNGMKRVIADNPQIKIISELSASHFARSGQNYEAFVAQIESYGFEIFMIDEESAVVTLADTQQMKSLETLNVLLKRPA